MIEAAELSMDGLCFPVKNPITLVTLRKWKHLSMGWVDRDTAFIGSIPGGA
jgi:hypothetical protein